MGANVSSTLNPSTCHNSVAQILTKVFVPTQELSLSVGAGEGPPGPSS